MIQIAVGTVLPHGGGGRIDVGTEEYSFSSPSLLGETPPCCVSRFRFRLMVLVGWMPRDFITKSVKEFRALRKLIASGLCALDEVRCRTPKVVFYVFQDVRGPCYSTSQGASLGTSSRISEVLQDDFQRAVMSRGAL